MVPIIGPLIGLIFAWSSTEWTTRKKVIATAIALFLAVVPILGLAVGGGGGGASNGSAWAP